MSKIYVFKSKTFRKHELFERRTQYKKKSLNLFVISAYTESISKIRKMLVEILNRILGMSHKFFYVWYFLQKCILLYIQCNSEIGSDLEGQFFTLNSQLNMRHSNCSMETEQSHFTKKIGFQAIVKIVCFTISSNTLKYFINVVFLVRSFLILSVTCKHNDFRIYFF